MISAETLLNYLDWKITFTLQVYASDKQLGDAISQNDKPINLFLRKLSKPQNNYTTTEKKLLLIVKCKNKFRGTIFGCEIKVYSDRKNLVYSEN